MVLNRLIFWRTGNHNQPLGGRYQITQQLGKGGFGTTFLAQDLHLPGSPLCVVKLLKPQVKDAKSLKTARRLFDTEAQVLYELGNHDQIPRLLAHFKENREFYLVQELVEGEPLNRELLVGRPWREDSVIWLLQDILQVLSFVHQQNVIHRDIKPANLIRRRQDGKIVLIDFGAVKQVTTMMQSPNSGVSHLTISIGSQGYMPKEQLGGNPRFSSDVYAVGMVGIQALTGIHPSQLREDRQTGEIVWRDRVPHISPEFATILERMLCYDFRMRYPTAGAALEALARLPTASVDHDSLLSSLPSPVASDTEVVATEEHEQSVVSLTTNLASGEPSYTPAPPPRKLSKTTRIKKYLSPGLIAATLVALSGSWWLSEVFSLSPTNNQLEALVTQQTTVQKPTSLPSSISAAFRDKAEYKLKVDKEAQNWQIHQQPATFVAPHKSVNKQFNSHQMMGKKVIPPQIVREKQ